MAISNKTPKQVAQDLMARGISAEDVVAASTNIKGAEGRGTLNMNQNLLNELLGHMAPPTETAEPVQEDIPVPRPQGRIEPVPSAEALTGMVQRPDLSQADGIELPELVAPEVAQAPAENGFWDYAKAASDTITAPFEKAPEYVVENGDMLYEQRRHEGVATTKNYLGKASPEQIAEQKQKDAASAPALDPNMSPVERRIAMLEHATDKHRKAVVAGKALRTPRTAGEVLGDAAVAVGAKGSLALGQMLYGALDFQSRYNLTNLAGKVINATTGTDFIDTRSLDQISSDVNKKLTGNDTAISQNFEQARKIVTENLNSPKLQAELDEVSAVNAQRSAGKEVRIETLLNQGYSELTANIKDIGGDIAVAGEAYLDNPAALVDMALESSVQLLVGGAVGKAAQSSVISRLAPAEVAAFKASTEGQKALRKVAARANISFVSASEGLSAAVDTKARILGKTEEELSSNIQYQDLRKEMSHEEARMRLSERGFDTSLAIVGLGAGVISKLTSGSFAGNIFNPAKSLDKAIPKAAVQGGKGFVVESVEEAGQSGLSQVVGNTAVKVFADKNTKISENVGQSIAGGALAGGLTGSTVGAATGSVGDLAKVAEKVSEQATKYAEKTAGSTDGLARKVRVEKAIATGNTESILDETNENYSPEDALAVLTSRKVLAEDTDTPIETKVASITKHVTNLFTELNEETEAATTPEELEKVAEKRAKLSRYAKAVGQIKRFSEMSTEEVDEAIATISEIGKPDEVAAQVLNSAPTLEQAESLLKTDGLSEDTTKEVNAYIETRRAVDQAKTLEEVNREVFHGSETNMGLDDHANLVRIASENKDEKSAKVAINNFAGFAKGHMAKYLALKEGFEAYKKDPQDPRVAELAEKTGITIDSTTGKLVAATKAEAFALKHALSESALMMTKAFGKAPKVTPEASANTSTVEPTNTTTAEVTTPDVATDVASTPTTTPAETKITAPDVKVEDIPSNIASDFAAMPDVELKESFDASVQFAATNKNAAKQTELANRELVKRYDSLHNALKVIDAAQRGDMSLTDQANEAKALQSKELATLVSEYPNASAAIAVAGKQKAGKVLTPKQEVSALKSLRRVHNFNVAKAAEKTSNPELSELIAKAGFADKMGDTVLAKELYAKVDKIQNETIAKRDAEATIKEYVGDYINTKNLRKTLSNTLGKVKKSDAGKRVDAIIGNIKKFVERVPYEKREGALKDIVAGLKIHANSQNKAKADTPFKRFGLRLANSFLEKPTYSIKRALEENKFLKTAFKVRKVDSVIANEKDFFAQEIEDMTVTKDMDEVEVAKLADIQEFVQEFASTFDEIFNQGNPNYTERNPSQELFHTPNGFNSDSNIVAGMAVVAYNYLADKAYEGIVNTDAAINALLPDKKPDDIVTPIESELLADVGNNMRTVAEGIGKAYMRALGISAPRNTPAIRASKMEISIGFQVIDVLQELGLVNVTSIANNSIDFVMGKTTDPSNQESTKFINVAVSEDVPFTVSEKLENFTTDMSAGRKVMEALFNVESSYTAPHDAPPEFTQEKLLGSDQDIPTRIKEIAEKSSHTKHKWKEELMGVYLSLDDEAQEIIGGIQHDLSGEHALAHASIMRNNEAKARGLQHMRDFWEGSQDKTSPFYFLHVVWKNFRMGIASNTINMQTDKNHRHVMAPESFTVKIGKSDLQLMDNFYIAVGEALGTSPDKESIATGVASARATIDKPVIQAAVDAFIAIEDWGHTPENQAALLDGAKAGGNNMFSLDGIAALAAQKRAYANGESSFTTTIGREVDGLTNGVAFSLLQIVSATSWSQLETMLARTGMFTDPDMTYAKWREQPGNYDSYEDISLGWTAALKSLKDAIATGVGYADLTKGEQRAMQRLKKNKVGLDKLNALETIVGSFLEDKETSSALDMVTKLGRQLAKDPLMTSNYGAAIKKIIANFSMTVLDKLHEEIAKNLATIEVTDKYIANNKGVLALKNFDKRAEARAEGAKARARVEELRNAVNTVVGKRVKLDKKSGLTDEVDVANFVGMVSDYFGAPLETAMEEKFGTFVESRKVLVKAVSEATTMFKKMYQARVEAEKAERKALDDNFIDLSREDYLEIERDLKNVMPIMANYFSESVEDGFMPVGKENIVTKDSSARVEYKYSKPRSYNERGHTGTHQTNRQSKPAASLNTMAYNQTFEDAGPNAVVGQVHGMDAATMYLTMAEYAAVNVHDALIFSLNDVEKGTEAFNKAMTDVAMSDFSIVDNVAEMHTRVSEAYAEMFPAEFNEDPNMVVALKVMQQETQQYRAVIKNKIALVQQYNKGEGGAHKTNLPSLTELGFQEVEAEFLETFNVPKPGERAPKRTAKSIYSKETAKEFLDEVEKAVESLDTRKGRRLLGTLRNEFEINFSNLEVYEAERANHVSLVLNDLQVVPVDMPFPMPDGAIAKDTGVTVGENFLKEVNYEYITDVANASSEYTVVDLFSTDTDVTTVVLRRPVDENQGTLFSDGNSGIDIENFTASTTREIDNMNTGGIFTALGKVGNVKDSIEHTKHLEKLMNTLVTKVMDPLKLHIRSQGNKTVGAVAGENVYLNVGRGMLVNGTQMSAQETFLHELSHHITEAGVNSNSMASRQLEKMWEASRKVIQPADFINRNANDQMIDKDGLVITEQSLSYPAELAAATERYNYIYNNTVNDSLGRNGYLHEFLVFGITNRAFMNALDRVDIHIDANSSLWRGVWAGSITATFNVIMARIADMLGRRVVGNDTAVNSKTMMRMAEALAGVENTKKGTIAAAYTKTTTALESKIREVAAWSVAPMTALLDSAPVQAIKPVGRAAKVVKNAIHTKAPAYAQALGDMSKRMGMTEKNLLGSIAREIGGSTKLSTPWETLNRIANKLVDQTRLAAAKGVESHIVDMYEEGVLTDEVRVAVLKGLLKTEASSLLDSDDYMASDVRNFIKDPAKLHKEIARLERLLDAYPNNKHYYRKMAKSLANYMVKGEHLEYEGKMNAHTIANLDGLEGTGVEIEGDVVQAEKIIDYLATLDAIRRTPANYKKSLNALMDSEFARDPVNNGITFTLAINKDFRERSYSELFGDDPVSYVKGYTKEIYDPNISYEVGTLADVEEFAKHNFTLVSNNPIRRDENDPNQEDQYLFINKDGLVTTWQAGATSMTSKKSKGTSQFAMRINTHEDITEASALAQRDKQVYEAFKAERVARLFSAEPSYVDQQKGSLVPTLTKKGKVASYRYLMNENVKDRLLMKNNDFVVAMGAMDGSIKDKVNSAAVNKMVVDLAYSQFKAEYRNDPTDFVKVGLDSTDPKYKEIYQMLPKEMRMEINRVWKGDNMYVPATLVPLIFGQRKWSVSSIGQDITLEGVSNDALRNVLIAAGNQLNKPWVKRTENVWQEIMKVVKDIIVVRSGVVLAGNVVSNILLLIAKGVNPVTAASDHAVAVRAANKHQADTKELTRLERMVRIGQGGADSALRISRLKNSIATNPVNDLIERGIFQSIVEDISTVDNEYTYKNQLQKWASPVTDKIPKGIKTGLKQVVIAQDTGVYKFLRDTTQLSDFVARYSLHQHNLKKGMNVDQSLQDIVRTFIDYDNPTHVALQYANDMGFVMFTKFFLRIQRVIADLILNHPGKTLSLFVLQNALADLPDILDSFLPTTDVIGKLNMNPIAEAISGVTALPVIAAVE